MTDPAAKRRPAGKRRSGVRGSARPGGTGSRDSRQVSAATPDRTKTHLEVGVVTRPHGVRGELKVKLHFADSDSLDTATEVTLQCARSGESTHRIEAVRHTAKGVLLDLEGLSTREAAEELRGAAVLVARSAVPALEPGEYYLADVVGCTVTVGERVVGIVLEVRPDPSIDTLVIEEPGGDRVEQPLGDAWVDEVDIEARRVRLSSEDGLIR